LILSGFLKNQFANREVDRRKIRLGDEIGQGHFGVVFRAVAEQLPNCDPLQSVAIKVMRQGQSASSVNSFIREGMRHKDLNHPNVVQLLGVCLTQEPYMIILEYLSFGDLKSLLRRCHELKVSLNLSHLCSFVVDTSSGFEYLHSQRFIHRDIAARNVLVGATMVAKIGDFGLCFVMVF
jgi:serine/threonine protein kinase